jgi:hypothetical protein
MHITFWQENITSRTAGQDANRFLCPVHTRLIPSAGFLCPVHTHLIPGAFFNESQGCLKNQRGARGRVPVDAHSGTAHVPGEVPRAHSISRETCGLPEPAGATKTAIRTGGASPTAGRNVTPITFTNPDRTLRSSRPRLGVQSPVTFSCVLRLWVPTQAYIPIELRPP